MAPTRSTTQGQAGRDNSSSTRQSSSTMNKLPRLPEGKPATPNLVSPSDESSPNPISGSKIQKRALPRRQQPNSSKSQLIYVSASTPFMSAVSRVRKQLDKSLKGNAPSTRGMNLNQRIDLLHRDNGTKGGNGEAIVLGTGRAIEKVLSIAAWFTEQSDCEVEVRTKTVGTVDDVVLEEEDEGFGEESRVRKISCLEVTVRLR
ncbi:Rpp20 subunit of nuclear RNase MRP and P-domain-containing protein [Colletotrichum lupini]|nr:Rpp20 subunit of nuclear RNase MRP and P-domain-containing protein [Colletotrichum lupini]